jgi:hypothetical protein
MRTFLIKKQYKRTELGVGIAQKCNQKWLQVAFWLHLKGWIGFQQDEMAIP